MPAADLQRAARVRALKAEEGSDPVKTGIRKWLEESTLALTSWPSAHALLRMQRRDLAVKISDADFRAFVTAGSSSSSAATSSSAAAAGSGDTVALQPMRKMSKQKAAFAQRVDNVDPQSAIADLDAKLEAKGRKTAQTYESSLGAYELFCGKRKRPMFPLLEDHVYEFFALADGCWGRSYTGMFNAMCAKNKEKKFGAFESEKCSAAAALLDDLAGSKQKSHQIPRDMLIGAAAEAETDLEKRAALDCMGQWFSCSRVDSFRSLRRTHIQTGQSSVEIEITNLKGRDKTHTVPLQMEAIPNPVFFKLGKKGVKTPFCPVSVFNLVGQYLKTGGGQLFGETSWSESRYNTELNSTLEELLQRAGYDETRYAASGRRCYTTHGLRAGGVCALLKAGLAKTVIDNMADWKTNQIRDYARMCALRPREVQAYARYNPIEMANQYKGADDDDVSSPVAKRRRTK